MNKLIFLISCLYLGLPAPLTFAYSTLALISKPDFKVMDISAKAHIVKLTAIKQEVDTSRLVSSSTLTAPSVSAGISVNTPTLPTLAEVKSSLLIARHQFNPYSPITGDEQDWAKGAVWVPNNSFVFTKTLDFRVSAYDRDVGTRDGAGIDSVNIVITDESGTTVHQRLEKNAGYCPFGGGEPECNILDFARSGYKWPNGTPIQSGSHQVILTVNSKDTSKLPLTWSFDFEIQR